MNLSDKTILITGGTGSFGKKFTEIVLNKYNPKKLIIFSRDEFKQSEMAKVFPEDKYPNIRYFLGDIRDKNRLARAFEGVDYVIHAAALKQVPALEYNPMEAVKTNIFGADNLINAAIDTGVKKVIALSTDKATNPANLYGATKLVAEKVFISANAFAGNKVKFSIVRYGNVVGSRGSVVSLFLNLKKNGAKEYPITDINMTRFWITLKQSVEFVLKALEESEGGEIFIPKIPSMKVVDLAKALEPDCKIKLIGIRPGEKINEIMISEEEARNTKIFNGIFVILPQFLVSQDLQEKYNKYSLVPEGFLYSSNKNDRWLTIEELKDMVQNKM